MADGAFSPKYNCATPSRSILVSTQHQKSCRRCSVPSVDVEADFEISLEHFHKEELMM